MARKTGRNDPCSCGSGKKYKNCCGRSGSSMRSGRLNQILAGLGLSVLLVIAALVYLQVGQDDATDDQGQAAPKITISPGSSGPVSPQTTQQPPTLPGSDAPGPPPRPGMVWSKEHGHWHRGPESARSNTPTIRKLDSIRTPVGNQPDSI